MRTPAMPGFFFCGDAPRLGSSHCSFRKDDFPRLHPDEGRISLRITGGSQLSAAKAGKRAPLWQRFRARVVIASCSMPAQGQISVERSLLRRDGVLGGSVLSFGRLRPAARGLRLSAAGYPRGHPSVRTASWGGRGSGPVVQIRSTKRRLFSGCRLATGCRPARSRSLRRRRG
jgi:hypothetical protein